MVGGAFTDSKLIQGDAWTPHISYIHNEIGIAYCKSSPDVEATHSIPAILSQPKPQTAQKADSIKW